MSKIVLIENNLNFRGTSNAIFQYGKHLEEISGHTCYVAAPAYSNLEALPKFQEYFGDRVILYKDLSDIPKVDIAYWIKYGTNDGRLIPDTKNTIHSVFYGLEPHGDKYCAVSGWLGNKFKIPYVNHIVTLPEFKGNYRQVLGIPSDAIVLGRHGGSDSFNIPYAHSAVYEVARQRSDLYFLFMNTDQFCQPLPNIIHIDGTHDQDVIRGFIETCDYGLHSRDRGETFGLAVCEYLFCNKPVITNINCPERNHIEVMGDKGVYYETAEELKAILLNLGKYTGDVRYLVDKFSPENVIKDFEKYFLAD